MRRRPPRVESILDLRAEHESGRAGGERDAEAVAAVPRADHEQRCVDACSSQLADPAIDAAAAECEIADHDIRRPQRAGGDRVRGRARDRGAGGARLLEQAGDAVADERVVMADEHARGRDLVRLRERERQPLQQRLDERARP